MTAAQDSQQLDRGGIPAPRFALDFLDRAIALLERQGDNSWAPVSEAELNGEGFSERVEELRIQMLVRDKTCSPVALILPQDQVVERHYDLEGSAPARFRDARQRLAMELGYKPEQLMVALPSDVDQGAIPVLAVLTQTAEEARGYAKRWGFTPGAVTTRTRLDGFANQLPEFRAAPPAGQRRKRTGRTLGLVAASVAIAAVVGFGLAQLDLAQVRAGAAAVAPPAPQAQLSFAAAGTERSPGPAPAALRAVRLKTPAGALSQVRLALPQHAAGLVPVLTEVPIQPVSHSPRELTAPGASVRVHVGAAPSEIGHKSPVRLARLGASDAQPDLSLMRAALVEIREDGPADVLIAQAPTASVLPPPADQEPPDTEAAVADAPEDETPTEFAPLEMAVLPPVRPTPAAPAEEAPPADAPEVAAVSPEAASAPAAPAGSLGAAALSPAPESDAAAAEELDPDAPTRFAAIEAPTPPVRPQLLAQRYQAAERARTRYRLTGPRSLRQAAERGGLELDSTSMIGVIQSRAGRQALVRMPTGDFRRVTRGDVLEGWRVSSISREAMRLTRGGQNRTLLLVLH